MSRRQRVRKQRLHPINLDLPAPTRLEVAWEELKASDFALWVRLNAALKGDLEQSLSALQRLFGWRERELINALRRLEVLGYVELEQAGPRKLCRIRRRALIRFGGSHFARLA